jgi:hypothetical protein
LGAVAFLALLLGASLPAGARAALSEPGAGSTLQAGQLVEVRWTGVPASAREIELVLSVDGGRTFPLRVTGELGPKSGSFFWRVPNLSSDQVSLALRVGIDGTEAVIAAGPAFRVRPDPTPGKTALVWKSGEIWLESDEESVETESVSHLPPDGFCAEPERLTTLARDAAPAFPTRLPGAGSSRRSPQTLRSAPHEPADDVGPASLSRTPLTIPQRI